MSTGIAMSDGATVTDLSERLVQFFSVGEGAEALFTADAFFDLNVPSWRFQIQGPQAVTDWLRGEMSGAHITPGRLIPTASGFVLEIETRTAPDGQQLYARQVLLCEVSGGRISEMVFYCTGDWDEDTQRRQGAEAPMIRQ